MSSTDYSLCSKTQAEARNEEFLRHAYGLFNRTALEDPGFVTATLAKYKKKEGQLWFNLLKRYGVQVLACPQATQQFGGGYLRSARETKKRVTLVSDSRDYQYNTILKIGEMDFLNDFSKGSPCVSQISDFLSKKRSRKGTFSLP